MPLPRSTDDGIYLEEENVKKRSAIVAICMSVEDASNLLRLYRYASRSGHGFSVM